MPRRTNMDALVKSIEKLLTKPTRKKKKVKRGSMFHVTDLLPKPIERPHSYDQDRKKAHMLFSKYIKGGTTLMAPPIPPLYRGALLANLLISCLLLSFGGLGMRVYFVFIRLDGKKTLLSFSKRMAPLWCTHAVRKWRRSLHPPHGQRHPTSSSPSVPQMWSCFEALQEEWQASVEVHLESVQDTLFHVYWLIPRGLPSQASGLVTCGLLLEPQGTFHRYPVYDGFLYYDCCQDCDPVADHRDAKLQGQSSCYWRTWNSRGDWRDRGR